MKMCLATLLLFAFVGSPNATEPLSVTVSPLQSIAPANLVVRVHVQPDAGNRSLEIVAESDTYYRSSTIDLDGADAPPVVSLELRNAPGGDYDVTAALIDSAGKQRTTVSQHVIVVDPADRD
jgi:hypothetical protein